MRNSSRLLDLAQTRSWVRDASFVANLNDVHWRDIAESLISRRLIQRGVGVGAARFRRNQLASTFIELHGGMTGRSSTLESLFLELTATGKVMAESSANGEAVHNPEAV
jgi:hypothetical protein